jgi:RNA polymerase sigma factor (sigma-70 family)
MAQVEGAMLLRRIRRLAALASRCPSHLTDSQLIQQFVAERDEGAFTALVQRHAPMVLRVCRGILHHQQDAEDACQAAFLVLARRARTIRKQQALSSWLHGVAYRVASRTRAQARRRQEREKTSAVLCATNAIDDLTVRELQAILHEELHRLPDKYRAPLLLCYWEGKTRDEAADLLGMTADVFKKRLERARSLLGSRLTRRGFVPSASCFTTLLLADNGAMAVSGTSIAQISQTALTFAAGNKAAAALTVTALAEGVIRTMSMTKWATVFITLVFVGALGTGIGYQVVESKQPDGPGVVQNKQPDGPGIAIAAAEQQPAKPKDPDKPPAPKAIEPYRIQTSDILNIRVPNAIPDEPIAGPYTVDLDGIVNLGLSYGQVLVVDLALDAAKKKIEEHLGRIIRNPRVELTLALGRVRAIERDLDLARAARELATNKLAEAKDRYAVLRERMRPKSELDVSELKTRIAAYQAEKNNLDIQRNENFLEPLVIGFEKSPPKDLNVENYVEVLKLRLKVIELQRQGIQQMLDGDRAATFQLDRFADDLQVLDESCKRFRKQVDRWDDRLQELEMELARLKGH